MFRLRIRTARKNGRTSKRQLQKRVYGRREWQKSARERTYRAVYHHAIGEEWRDYLASIPLILLAYRYFSTRVRLRLTTARGHPRRPFLLFLTHPRRVHRTRQKATNGADSERKECSRRLNWLGNGWFMARFTTADPQSATPLARERREEVRDSLSPVAFLSRELERIMYLYPADVYPWIWWGCKWNRNRKAGKTRCA